MSYSSDELLLKFRQKMDDLEVPYLWSDPEVFECYDEAAAEFCDEVDVIADQIDVPYVALDESVTQPPYITRLRKASIGGKKLNLFNAEQWDGGGCGMGDDYGSQFTGPSEDWQTDTADEPTALITDLETGQLRLYPTPTNPGAITLRVYRKPVTFMEDGEEPEIAERTHQRALIFGARSCAYLKHDSETYNLDAHQTMHEHFLERLQVFKTRVKRRDRRAGTTRYGGL